jgi:hypothetical protein
MSQEDFLTKELNEQISKFDRDSKKHKEMHRALRYASFFLTGISGLLAGLAIAYPQWHVQISLGIVFVTSATAVVTSVDGLRKPGELWIHERSTHYQLRDIKCAFDFALAGATAPVSPTPYFEQMQAVLGAASDKWQRNIILNSKSAQTATS